MVDVDMSSTPLKVIGGEVCLWAKGPSGLSKELGPKGVQFFLWKEESKEIRDSMKVEDGMCIVKDTMGVAQKNKL